VLYLELVHTILQSTLYVEDGEFDIFDVMALEQTDCSHFAGPLEYELAWTLRRFVAGLVVLLRQDVQWEMY
jgi:hypothetical protein